MFKGIKAHLISILVVLFFSVGWTPSGLPPLRDALNMSVIGSTLLVSDRTGGLHVYDVSDPANPSQTVFIPLDGNTGSAAKDDIIYANDYGALLAIRVDGDTYEVVKTIKSDDNDFDGYYGDVEVGRNRWGWTNSSGYGCACNDRTDYAVYAPEGGSSGSSFATFAVIANNLYYIDDQKLVTLDISVADDPVELNREYIGWPVETIFPTDHYLFLGGTRGMYIFDRSDPTKPAYLSQVQHFRACDPVVVEDDIAFVTLRGNAQCGQATDELLVVDISNPVDPDIIGRKLMETPYGLALSGDRLFVGTGTHGFELFDVADPANPTRVADWEDPDTKDFIWSGDLLYTMGFGDLRIYGVASPESPVLLSEVE